MSTAAAVASGIPTRTPKPSMRIARTIAIQDHSAPCDARTVTIASAVVTAIATITATSMRSGWRCSVLDPRKRRISASRPANAVAIDDDEARDVGLLDAG